MFDDIINESNEGAVYPVFVILSYSGTMLSSVIKSVTGQPYSHASLSFDPSMTKMYSFGRGHIERFNMLDATFTTENLMKMKTYGADITYSIYVTFVTLPEKELMLKKIQEISDKHNIKRMRYNFIGLFFNRFNIVYNRSDSYFCSEFVDVILKTAGKGIDKKSPSLVRPYDYTKLKKFQFVMKGNGRKFNEDRLKSKLVSLSSLNYRELLYETQVN